jgi:hypothetical protein
MSDTLNRYYHEEFALGYPVFCEVLLLDDGVQALIFGGCMTHIGSVSIAEPGRTPDSTRFPGHKDYLIGDKWAQTLSAKLNVRTVAVCGIHYDNPAAEGIREITSLAERMLSEVLRWIDARI